jgi:hypothetical protein
VGGIAIEQRKTAGRRCFLFTLPAIGKRSEKEHMTPKRQGVPAAEAFLPGGLRGSAARPAGCLLFVGSLTYRSLLRSRHKPALRAEQMAGKGYVPRAAAALVHAQSFLGDAENEVAFVTYGARLEQRAVAV